MQHVHDRPTGRTRILVVEDERIVALDLSRTLVELGYEVCGTASSAEAAIAITEERKPDLALMDINLDHGTDGIDLAVKLRDRFHVPVVFMTGMQDDRTLQLALRAQPLGYVHKPVQTQRLQSAIELAVAKWRIEGELSARMHSLEERCAELALMNEMGELLLIGETRNEIAAIAQRFGRKVFGGSGV